MAHGHAQLIRQAERVIACHAATKRAPRVLWLELGETEEAFADRCTRLALTTSRLLAAVPFGFKTPDCVQKVELPPKLFRLFHPSIVNPPSDKLYRIAWGGRAGGKSRSVAIVIVLAMLSAHYRVLACREFQKALRESTHHVIAQCIRTLRLDAWFNVRESEIGCPVTASEIIFQGLGINAQNLLSLEGINLVWIDQAESISQASLDFLTPTIRELDGQIWATCNPDDPRAPIMECIDGKRSKEPNILAEYVTYADNPWFDRTSLEGDRAWMAKTDPDGYAHVWLGHTRGCSDAVVFKGKWSIEEFTPVPPRVSGYYSANAPKPWDGPYLGIDFGYSQDPSVLIKAWIFERKLYVEHEAYGIGVDIDRLPALFDQVPDARKYVARADNARPETVSYLRRNGYGRVESVTKKKGSVEDGVAHLRSYEQIIVHPRCVHVGEEMRLFSYRVDRLSGDVLPDLVDKNDHCIDALRYALQPVIAARREWRIVPLNL